MEKKILAQVNAAIGEAIVKELVGYNKPLSNITQKVINKNEVTLFNLINEEVVSLLGCEDFRVELKKALNAKLARTLISRIGGELEKRVNELRSDPTTRAKITLAIDNIVNEVL
jgi:hypothetical protein